MSYKPYTCTLCLLAVTVAAYGGAPESSAYAVENSSATVSLTAAELPRIAPFVMSRDLANVSIVQWDRQSLRAIANTERAFRVQNFPIHATESIDMRLKAFSITGPDSRFVVRRPGEPDQPVDFDPSSMLLMRGEVIGHPGSHVYLALGDRISTGSVDLGPGRKRFRVSSSTVGGERLPAGQLSVFLPTTSTNLPPGVPLCGVEGHDLIDPILGRPINLPDTGDEPARIVTPTVRLKTMELAIDTDYEYYILMDDEADATAYLFTVYGAVSDIYMRDVDTRIILSFTRIWTDPNDLYNGSDPLSEFTAEWTANMGAVQRDAAQLFSGRRNYPFGGQAFLASLCNNGYGVVGYVVGFLPDPTRPHPFNWDVSVTAHELGHTSGTGHTHDDPNLNPNFVDTCNNPNTTPQRGSIMSYCGQTWSGMNANTDNYFHRRIQPNMDAHITTSACIVADCNMNDIDDASDILGLSDDTNSNGIPDECEDCNENSILDPLDISNSTSDDDNSNGIPDECEPDCNDNGIPDDKDIADGTSPDAYGNDIPDECEEDCNTNGVSDYTEIQVDMTLDVDRNAYLDSCQDCDGDLNLDHDELNASHYAWVTSGLDNNPLRQFFPETGVLTQTSAGSGTDLVDQGQDLIVAPNGHVLVSDAASDRVMEFDADGNLIPNFITSGAGGLNHPAGLVITSGGTLLVASRLTDSVLAFDGTNGTPQGAFVSAGSGGLSRPFGLTFGPNGNLYVTSETNEVFEFDGGNGSFIAIFVTASSNGGLDQPRGLTFKSDGNLLVASYGTDEVLEFNGSTGAPMGKWAQVGTATAITQDSPWGIRVGPNGHVFVSRTGTDFSSPGRSNGGVAESHLTDARMFEFDVCTGLFRKTHIGGNDHGLNFATGFDFVPGFGIDCNQNQMQDDCDVTSGFSSDTNTNGVPDECEVDCNGNGTQDLRDLIPFGTSVDCNCNFQPDECDISAGLSQDCDSNGVPDECEDCNGNGIGDACDISSGGDDCNENGTLDECESDIDCNSNGTADICDLFDGTSFDCNDNGVPDTCDAAGGGLLAEVDFETGLPFGWAVNGIFQVTGSCPVTPACDGTAWAYAGNTGSCSYSNQEQGTLVSPVINLPLSQTSLEFCSMVDTEAGFDFAEVLVNGDVVYQDSGQIGDWQQESIDLSAYGGQAVTVTFRLISDTFVTGFGWQVDNIRIIGGSEDTNGNQIPDECEGACCLGDASCLDGESGGTCGAADGVFQGVATICATSNCQPFGACCVGTTCLSSTTVADCLAAQGVYLGDSTVCDPTICGEANPPVAAAAPHDRRKNRYVSFEPNNTEPVAFQVTLVTSLFHTGAVGQSAWVDVPDPVTGLAPLTTSGPVTRVWTEPVVHAGGCLVAPVAEYTIHATVNDGASFSPPLLVETINQPTGAKWWGDTVGHFDTTEWTPPQGVTNFDDVFAVIKAFQVASNAPHGSVADVEPQILNRVQNFNDVFQVILAFQGKTYPFGCPNDPCQDSSASALSVGMSARAGK